VNEFITEKDVRVALEKIPARLDDETKRLFAEALAMHPDFGAAFTPPKIEFDYTHQLGFRT